MTRRPGAAVPLVKASDAADVDAQLAQLAVQINREHEAIRSALSSGLEQFRSAKLTWVVGLKTD